MKGKLLTVLAAAAMFSACTETSISDINSETKEVGTVDVTVYNARNRMPIDEADVYSFDMNKHRYTDSTGKIVWKNFEIGDLWFDISKDGYARIRKQVHITDIIANDVARVENLHLDVNMYELGMEVSGKVYYRDLKTGNLVPAAGVTVIGSYSDADIYPSEVTVKTDSTGSYTFKKLPVGGVTCEFKTARAVIDDVVYEVTKLGSKGGLRVGDAHELDLQVMPRIGLLPKIISSNLSSIDVESEIKLNFSEVLEADSVRSVNVKVLKASGDTVLTDISLDKEGKTITVKPTSGRWVDGDDYELYFQVWTKVGISSKNDAGAEKPTKMEFTVGSVEIPNTAEGIRLMDDPMVTVFGNDTYAHEETDFLQYNSSVALEWDEVESASGYRVYYKGNTDASADYIFAGEVKKDTKFAFSFNKFNLPFDGKQPSEVTFKVIPYNVAGQALGEDAKELEVNIGSAAQEKLDAWREANVKGVKVKFAASSLGCATEAACKAGKVQGTLQVSWSRNKDFKVDGFNVYVKNADDEWAYATSVSASSDMDYNAYIYSTQEASPFYGDAQDYDDLLDAEFSANVMVLPYFETRWNDEFGYLHVGKVESTNAVEDEKSIQTLVEQYFE